MDNTSDMCGTNEKISRRHKKITPLDEYQKTYPYLNKMDSKIQRKEIQKIKNRISAQNYRDQIKQELKSLKEENAVLKAQISHFKQSLDIKCENCGHAFNLEIQKRVSDYKRLPSNSFLLKTITILAAIFLFSVHDKLSILNENNKNSNSITHNNYNFTSNTQNKENLNYSREFQYADLMLKDTKTEVLWDKWSVNDKHVDNEIVSSVIQKVQHITHHNNWARLMKNNFFIILGCFFILYLVK